MGKKEKSAGILLFKKTPEIKVLLIHPSGAYNKNAPWSIPKGKKEGSETEEQTARREVLEEVGIDVKENLTSLDKVVYKSGKQVYAYYAEVSDTIIPILNWENDEYRFCTLDEARTIIMPAQKPFIQHLRHENPYQF
jgi:predicted NUDIX family NTP pyrophosphohydrolase